MSPDLTADMYAVSFASISLAVFPLLVLTAEPFCGILLVNVEPMGACSPFREDSPDVGPAFSFISSKENSEPFGENVYVSECVTDDLLN